MKKVFTSSLLACLVFLSPALKATPITITVPDFSPSTLQKIEDMGFRLIEIGNDYRLYEIEPSPEMLFIRKYHTLAFGTLAALSLILGAWLGTNAKAQNHTTDAKTENH